MRQLVQNRCLTLGLLKSDNDNPCQDWEISGLGLQVQRVLGGGFKLEVSLVLRFNALGLHPLFSIKNTYLAVTCSEEGVFDRKLAFFYRLASKIFFITAAYIHTTDFTGFLLFCSVCIDPWFIFPELYENKKKLFNGYSICILRLLIVQ